MKSRPTIIISICLLVFTLLAAILGGCGSTDYATFVFDKYDLNYRYRADAQILMYVIPQFTVEYPSSFEFRDAYSSKSACVVEFDRKYEREPYWSEQIQIEVYEPSYTGSTGHIAFQYNIVTGNYSGSLSPDYQIGDFRKVDSATVEIAGLPAKYEAYSFQWLRWSGNPISNGELIRRASFSHSGYTWVVSMETYLENAEETEVYWNHLLETFRFID